MPLRIIVSVTCVSGWLSTTVCASAVLDRAKAVNATAMSEPKRRARIGNGKHTMDNSANCRREGTRRPLDAHQRMRFLLDLTGLTSFRFLIGRIAARPARFPASALPDRRFRRAG